MIPEELVQAALITKLKGATGVVGYLNSADEIKEAQWQGTTFKYPAVRVKMGIQTPLPEDCASSIVPFIVICKGEKASSKTTSVLASAVVNALQGRRWCDIIQGVRFVAIRAVGVGGIAREDALTWKAEASFRAIVEPYPSP
jgi:hypothetical protein